MIRKNAISFISALTLFSMNLNGIEWSEPIVISNPGKPVQRELSLDLNDNHFAIATWIESDGTSKYIISTIFDESWGTPLRISSFKSSISFPEISLNQSNDAMVTWDASEERGYSSCLSLYSSGNWSPEIFLSAGGNNTIFPRIDMNEEGKALAIWTIKNRRGSILRSSFFDGSKWSSRKTLAEGHIPLFTFTRVNDDSHAATIWLRKNGKALWIESSYFDGMSWSSAKKISKEEDQSYDPHLAMSRSGDFMAAWAAKSSSLPGGILISKCVGGTWSSAETIHTSQTGIQSIDLAMHDANNAALLWCEFCDGKHCIKSRLLLNGSWSRVFELSSTHSSTTFPAIAMNNTNMIVATWLSNNENESRIEVRCFQNGKWDDVKTLSNQKNTVNGPSVVINNHSKAMISWSYINDRESGIAVSSNFIE